MNENPEELYLKMLTIGTECVSCGISFNDLKSRLKEAGYTFDDNYLEHCLKEWFYMSFFHEEAHCKGSGGYTNVGQLKCHMDCHFTIKAEACMRLLTFKESENNRVATSNNLKSIKTANKIAYIALGITALGFFKSCFIDDNPSKYLHNIQSRLDTTSTQLSASISNFQYQQQHFQDSLYKILNSPSFHIPGGKVGSQQGKGKSKSK